MFSYSSKFETHSCATQNTPYLFWISIKQYLFFFGIDTLPLRPRQEHSNFLKLSFKQGILEIVFTHTHTPSESDPRAAPALKNLIVKPVPSIQFAFYKPAYSDSESMFIYFLCFTRIRLLFALLDWMSSQAAPAHPQVSAVGLSSPQYFSDCDGKVPWMFSSPASPLVKAWIWWQNHRP